VVRRLVADAGIEDLICSKVRPAGTATAKKLVPLGMRWPIERTNSWLSNYGQLRRNTDRRVAHRLAQLALAIVLLLTAKLIDWRAAGITRPPPPVGGQGRSGVSCPDATLRVRYPFGRQRATRHPPPTPCPFKGL
jgi:hypothetical protein